MLEYEPTKRLTLAAALRHPFFQSTVSGADQNAGKSWEGNRDISRWQWYSSSNQTSVLRQKTQGLACQERVNVELNWHWLNMNGLIKQVHSIWFLNHLPIMWEPLHAQQENVRNLAHLEDPSELTCFVHDWTSGQLLSESTLQSSVLPASCGYWFLWTAISGGEKTLM